MLKPSLVTSSSTPKGSKDYPQSNGGDSTTDGVFCTAQCTLSRETSLPIDRRTPSKSSGTGSNSHLLPFKNVHWDEETIAVHDLERGTRQKIDEPDTPFVRSPATTSDTDEFSENHSSGTDDAKKPSVQFEFSTKKKHLTKTKSANPAAVVKRLNEWMLDKPRREGDTSPESSQELSRNKGKRHRRKISLPEDENKGSSDAFQLKRDNHYREMAIMAQAQKQGYQDSDSDPDQKVLVNTNTNINQGPLEMTRSKRERRRPSFNSNLSYESDDASGGASACISESERSERSACSSASGNHEFIEKRKKHYDEGSMFRVIHGQVRTNTNTNINASQKFVASAEPNPMEAAEMSRNISVQFPADERDPISAEAFVRRRREHSSTEGEWMSSSHASSDREETSSQYRKERRHSTKSVELAADVHVNDDSVASIHARAFEQKRRNHYNEGEMLKQMRLRLALEAAADSDDEDDEDRLPSSRVNPSEPSENEDRDDLLEEDEQCDDDDDNRPLHNNWVTDDDEENKKCDDDLTLEPDHDHQFIKKSKKKIEDRLSKRSTEESWGDHAKEDRWSKRNTDDSGNRGDDEGLYNESEDDVKSTFTEDEKKSSKEKKYTDKPIIIEKKRSKESSTEDEKKGSKEKKYTDKPIIFEKKRSKEKKLRCVITSEDDEVIRPSPREVLEHGILKRVDTPRSTDGIDGILKKEDGVTPRSIDGIDGILKKEDGVTPRSIDGIDGILKKEDGITPRSIDGIDGILKKEDGITPRSIDGIDGILKKDEYRSESEYGITPRSCDGHLVSEHGILKKTSGNYLQEKDTNTCRDNIEEDGKRHIEEKRYYQRGNATSSNTSHASISHNTSPRSISDYYENETTGSCDQHIFKKVIFTSPDPPPRDQTHITAFEEKRRAHYDYRAHVQEQQKIAYSMRRQISAQKEEIPDGERKRSVRFRGVKFEIENNVPPEDIEERM